MTHTGATRTAVEDVAWRVVDELLTVVVVEVTTTGRLVVLETFSVPVLIVDRAVLSGELDVVFEGAFLVPLDGVVAGEVVVGALVGDDALVVELDCAVVVSDELATDVVAGFEEASSATEEQPASVNAAASATQLATPPR